MKEYQSSVMKPNDFSADNQAITDEAKSWSYRYKDIARSNFYHLLWKPYHHIGGVGNFNISLMTPPGLGKGFLFLEEAERLALERKNILAIESMQDQLVAKASSSIEQELKETKEKL